jgi:hypothetical protein
MIHLEVAATHQEMGFRTPRLKGGCGPVTFQSRRPFFLKRELIPLRDKTRNIWHGLLPFQSS